MLTLAESLAMAVLKGDLVAAYALADLLEEQRDNPKKLTEQAVAIRGQTPLPVSGYEVYHWPEFETFCRRLGIVWDLYTLEITIRLPAEGPVEVHQSYRGHDLATPSLPMQPEPVQE